MERTFRLYDFNVFNEKKEATSDEESNETCNEKNDNTSKFLIQMFGKNEKGESCSIIAEGFKPFFYVKVNDSWTTILKNSFVTFIKIKLGKYYESALCDCKLIKRKKLY